MGGHFFRPSIADGECWGGEAPMNGFAFFDFSLQKYMCFLCQLEKMIYFCG